MDSFTFETHLSFPIISQEFPIIDACNGISYASHYLYSCCVFLFLDLRFNLSGFTVQNKLAIGSNFFLF